MNCNLSEILSDQHFTISSTFIKIALENNVNINEFLLLMYFNNTMNKEFDLPNISKYLHMKEEAIMESFNSLLAKGFLTISSDKDMEGRLTEKVSLNNFFLLIEKDFHEKKVEETKIDIFATFEQELGRPISPMEYEIINAWQENGTSEELVLGALKEAVYNGVSNFRYIDKIIYEWRKKGFKNMDDVKKHMQTRNEERKKPVELFDYNWLEDDEN